MKNKILVAISRIINWFSFTGPLPFQYLFCDTGREASCWDVGIAQKVSNQDLLNHEDQMFGLMRSSFACSLPIGKSC